MGAERSRGSVTHRLGPSSWARHAGPAAMVLAAALWGLGGTTAGQLFARGADPLEVVEVRTWVALAGFAALYAVRRRRRRAERPKGSAHAAPAAKRVDRRAVLGFGIAVAVSNAALFLAIDKLPVAVALVLQNLAPAFVVGWVLLVTRTLPSPRVVLGLVVALLSVALVVELPTTPLGDIDAVGILLGLLAGAGVAAFSVLGARAAGSVGTLVANTGGFTVAAVAWLLFQLPHGLPALFEHPALLAGAVAVGVFGTFVPFLLYAWAAARVGPQAGAVNISLEPLFGAVLAWLWLGQAVTPVQIVGGLVLLVAVVFLQSSRNAAPPPVRPPTDQDPAGPQDRPAPESRSGLLRSGA
ncbi:Permease of the drug/metabolite transporter (DMT) superfamily [Streptomyces formicae]|uniref:Permease of the drug/metabolite transporter (DMT) superfamily n=1 Tax=Streptomyces formicae TaxID=1616117 RepID=A0A291QHS6_9ACTN|nr:Permease of the drug/metabolite transporter (DMT) superfamily [Streptomyces formicae]